MEVEGEHRMCGAKEMLFFMTYLIFFQFIFVLLTINMVFNSVSDGAAQREVISFHALLLTLNWTLEFRTGVI